MSLHGIVFLITIVLCIFAWCYFKLIKRAMLSFSKKNSIGLPVKSTIFMNAFQSVTYYDASKYLFIDQITLLLTYHNFPFLKYLSTSDLKSYVVLSMCLTQKAPCFYAVSKKSSFKHTGQQLSKKFLLNKTKYNVFGCVSDSITDFLMKYNIQYMYSSYLPFNTKYNNLKSNFVELKISLNEVTSELLNDFILLFENVEMEPISKVEKNTNEYEIIRKKEKANENVGVFDRLKLEIQKKNGVIKK